MDYVVTWTLMIMGFSVNGANLNYDPKPVFRNLPTEQACIARAEKFAREVKLLPGAPLDYYCVGEAVRK